MQTFPTGESQFQLTSPEGELEVWAASPKVNAGKNISCIICHPHPLFGGTMTNKVVTTLARVCSDLGVKSVRFNFRGVGKSTGKFADGEGELLDLFAVLNWVKQVNPQDEIWLAGFSFGAAIAAIAATTVNPAQLITIAPPTPRFGLPEIAPIMCPWVVVQGEEDDVVLPHDVYAWIETRDPKPQVIRIANAGHFFHGKLLELREQLEANLPTKKVNG